MKPAKTKNHMAAKATKVARKKPAKPKFYNAKSKLTGKNTSYSELVALVEALPKVSQDIYEDLRATVGKKFYGDIKTSRIIDEKRLEVDNLLHQAQLFLGQAQDLIENLDDMLESPSNSD
jgi:hypothetical protein